MYHRIIEVDSPGTRLRIESGSLKIEASEGRVAHFRTEELDCVLLSHPGVSLSNGALAELMAANVQIVACDRRFQPVGVMAQRVRSGDVDNVEAQAAMRFWKRFPGLDHGRKRYAKFRSTLLKWGYATFQKSIYIKYCQSDDYCHTIRKMVARIAPAEGIVNSFSFTDLEFERQDFIRNGAYSAPPSKPAQMEFY